MTEDLKNCIISAGVTSSIYNTTMILRVRVRMFGALDEEEEEEEVDEG